MAHVDYVNYVNYKEPMMIRSVTCQIDNVVKRFGSLTALDGVSFPLRHGITGLLGPNGAGKTTLLTMLATIATPDAGRIESLGFDPSRHDGRLAIRRRLGYMPQEPGFHRGFTVHQFVDYVAVLKEWVDPHARVSEVDRVIELVGLGDKSGAKIKTLSGGMRRRLALAQALIGDPQLLVLDEPTAGLDPERRLRFRDLVSRLGEDRTVVVSTHQTEDVAAMCQDVVVLHEGRVRFAGTPAELLAYAHERVWIAEQRDSGAVVAWRTSDGRYRHIGRPPPGTTTIAPTVEDAYLLLLGDDSARQEATA